MTISWEKTTEATFKTLISKIPDPIRGIAETRVSKKAEALVRADNRNEITEKDMVDAFFAETPFGFHGLMKTDMETAGIDYTKYGHKR